MTLHIFKLMPWRQPLSLCFIQILKFAIMKQLRLLTLSIFVLISTFAKAQTHIHPWGIGVTATATNMEGLINHNYLQLRNYTGGGQIYIARYLTPSFNLRLVYGLGNLWYPNVLKYPYVEKGVNHQLYYHDLTLLLEFKLNNNYVFKEDAIVQPYIMAGFGANYMNHDYNTYFPWGGGIRFKVTKWMSLNVETLYKINIDNSFSYLQHSAGVQFNMGKRKAKKADEVTNATTSMTNLPPKKVLTDEELGLKKSDTDTDGDGVKDMDDECPFAPGPASLKGCPDTDGDGIPDARDNCPFAKGSIANQGCPDELADRDKDGIVDDMDECPDIPGIASAHGCPGGKTVAPVKDITLPKDDTNSAQNTNSSAASDFVAGNYTELFYTSSSSELKAEQKAMLDKIAVYLQEHQELHVKLNGFTSNIGKDAANIELAMNRALKVATYLASKGVNMRRINTYGYGPFNNKYSFSEASENLKNQRVEIVLQ